MMALRDIYKRRKRKTPPNLRPIGGVRSSQPDRAREGATETASL